MKTTTFITVTALAAVLSGGSIVTHADTEKAKAKKDMHDWAAMRAKAIGASEILDGDVKNFANRVGRTEELILNEKGTAIEYVLYEVPYPYSYYTGEDGFVNYDAVEVDDGYYGGVDLLIEDADVSLPRDQLTLTRGEVIGRRISHLIDSDITFADGEAREVEDILVHPKTGMVTHYVVEMNPDALFDEESRTVRAKNVSIKADGSITANLKSTEVDSSQDYDSRFF